MRVPTLLFAATLACACAASRGPLAAGDARKGLPECPESTSACLTGTRCEVDTKRDCMLCVCRTWDDTSPPASGRASQARPEGIPVVPPPPVR